MPRYIGDVWCERMHLSMDEMATGIDPDTQGPAPLIYLKHKDGGENRIIVPPFAFSDNGHIVPVRLEDVFAATYEDRFVIEQIRSVIESAKTNYGENVRFCYFITSEAWPKKVAICASEHELVPDPRDFTVEQFDRTNVIDDHIAPVVPEGDLVLWR